MRRRLTAAIAAISTLLLGACGGGSSSGGATLDSPFVGTYKGAGTFEVTTGSRSRSTTDNVLVFVHRDGLVQVGETQSTIYASGPLNEQVVVMREEAATLIDAACSGEVFLTGSFNITGGDQAVFRGRWSSREATCFGASGFIDGTVTVERTSTRAKGSRVYQTSQPALRELFRDAAGR